VAAVSRVRAREANVEIDDVGVWYDIDRIGDVARLAEDLERAPDECPRTLALLRRWKTDFVRRGILPARAPEERSSP
jgi:hypothetical protein